MYFLFIDDSEVSGCKRKELDKITSLGGIIIRSDNLQSFINNIDSHIEHSEIPNEEEIKWSPKPESFIYTNLHDPDRFELYNTLLEAALECGSKAIVISHDLTNTINKEKAYQNCMDYLLERYQMFLEANNSFGIMISDRPGGGKKQENEMLEYFLNKIQEGTEYVKSDNIPLNILSTPSKLLRPLQIADLVVSITTQLVCGNYDYAEQYSDTINRFFIKNRRNTIGGTGLKLFPPRLLNIYHHVLGEDIYCKSDPRDDISLPVRGNYFFQEV